jgi:Family of unknown function (DUF6069)
MAMHTNTLTSAPRATHGRSALRRLALAGGATAATTAVVNVLVRSAGVVLGAVPSDYTMLQPGFVAGASIFGIALATILFAALMRLNSHPIVLFRAIVAVGGLLSLGSPIMAAAGKLQGIPATGTSTVVTMVVMHGVAAATAAFFLPALAWRGATGLDQARADAR